MGLFERFKRSKRLTERSERKSAGGEMQSAARSFGVTHASGKNSPRRGTAELIAAYREIPALRNIVQKIAEGAASTDWEVYRTMDAMGRSTKNKGFQRSSFPSRERIKKEVEYEVLDDDPILDLLDYGCGVLSGFEVLQLSFTYFLLKGESFIWIQRDKLLGVPVGLWPIPPHWVDHVPSQAAVGLTTEESEGKICYEISFSRSATPVKVPLEDIIYTRDPDPDNPYVRGAGVGETLGDELDSDEYIAQFTKAFFLNNATPNMVVSFEDASIEELRHYEQRWLDKHRGSLRSHLVHFVSPKPEIETFDSSLREMTLIEMRSFLRQIIRETFGVPPEIVGLIENSNRSTINAASFIFSRWVLVPLLERFRSSFQKKLIPQFDERKVLGYVSPVPEDREYILQVAMAAPYSRTVNEWRELQGLEPVEGGDDLTPPGFGMGPTDPMMLLSNKPKITKSTKAIALTSVDIDSMVALLTPDFLSNELANWASEATTFGVKQMKTLNDVRATAGLGKKVFDPNSTRVAEHLSTFFGERLTNINNTTRAVVKDILVQGVVDGVGPQELSRRIHEATGLGAPRARQIAVTEVNRSANFTNWEAQKMSGVVNKRRWVTSFRNSRPSHAAAHGQMVDIDKPFIIGGNPTYYPGQTGVASEDINCGCTTVAVIDPEILEAPKDASWLTKQIVADGEEVSEDQAEKITDKFDDSKARWVNLTSSAVSKALDNQRQLLLDKLVDIARRQGVEIDV